MGRVSPGTALLAALLLGAAARPCPAQEEDDPATARWDQYGGNSGRTFASMVEPVRATPRVLWNAKTSGDPCGEPVAWDGTLYAASSTSPTNVVLEAFALADGRRIAKGTIGKDPLAHIAVARGMVVVADGTSLRGYQLQGSGFTLRWTHKVPQAAPPTVFGDLVYGCSFSSLDGCDPLTGKVQETSPQWSCCAPVMVSETGRTLTRGAIVTSMKGYVGNCAALTDGQRDRAVAWFRAEDTTSARLTLSRIPRSGGKGGAWLLHSDRIFRGADEDLHGAIQPDGGGDAFLVPCSYPMTIWKSVGIGFQSTGLLVSIRTDGSYVPVLDRSLLPKGARPGPATRARNVVQFSNWAVDLDTARVLWCLPESGHKGRLLPVADRLLMSVTEYGSFQALTDRPEGAAPEARPAAAGTSAIPSGPAGPAAPPAALPPPLGGDGVLLADGTSVEGAVEVLRDGRFRVEPEKGEIREEPAEGLLLVRKDGKVLHRGAESAVLGRWRGTLHPRAVDCLLGIHERLAKDGLHAAAAAVVADARTFGLSENRAADLTRRAGAVKANAFVEKVLAGHEPRNRDARGKSRLEFLAASDWCRERGFMAAGACLLAEAGRMSPDPAADEKRAVALLPAFFPWADQPVAGKYWMAWAAEIAAADASFVPLSELGPRLAKSGPWSGKVPVILLRTPHVLFWSRTFEPQVVGRCLRNAEYTCRALTHLVGADQVFPPRTDLERMDVRLHADEAGYRAEGEVEGIPVWSAGCYDPETGISRFFVPDPEDSDPLGRGLFQVLSHELTHHFLDRLWKGTRKRPDRNPGDPAFWAIEGIARFVEDQVVEMDRRGLRFDDRTVPSLESAAQAAAKGVLFPPSVLIALSQSQFATLSPKEFLPVRLRNTLQTRILSPLTLFYEQSGATAYFLVMERGEEGRKAFFRYLAEVYAGMALEEGWKALGFASVMEFDQAIREFLKGLK